jgi:hypothetical protein
MIPSQSYDIQATTQHALPSLTTTYARERQQPVRLLFLMRGLITLHAQSQ